MSVEDIVPLVGVSVGCMVGVILGTLVVVGAMVGICVDVNGASVGYSEGE